MSPPIVVLLLTNFAAIAILPKVFFRKGRLNRAWWLTAAPFGLSGIGIVVVAAGLDEAVLHRPGLEVVATIGAALSIALIGATLGAHSRPLSLWHQPNDAPTHLVTSGPYGRVRHPFYAAFLLTLVSCALAAPHALTLAGLVLGGLRLDQTARREERGFLRSPFGGEYAAYMAVTGRFLPRLRPTPAQRSTSVAFRR